jgi:hypothetical protein
MRKAIGLTLLVAGTWAANAAIITGATPGGPGQFGDLQQANTNCTGGTNGCGPTAAVNSFVMLQERYPSLYGELLVPSAAAGNDPTQNEMAAVANQLGDSELANPNPTMYMDCQACNGTYIENFITGKYKYIEEQAPGVTRYKAYMGGTFAWRNDPGNVTPGFNNGGQPSWVTRGAPTAEWLAAELNHGEDIEVFVEYTNGNSHYLTLFSLSFDDQNNTGTMGFIDPLTGGVVNSNITGLAGGYLTLNYGGGATLFHAVSESPVPEPGTWLLLSFGSVALLFKARRSASR